MSSIRIYTCLLLTFGFLFIACGKKDIEVKEIKIQPEEPIEIDEDSRAAFKFVADMGIGINLGNSLDTRNRDKTYWGNVLPTKAMIDKMAERGFKTFRLPVTWQYNMGDAPNYTIEKDYLDWVEEIAGWALDNEMYVIINSHHDDEWVVPANAKVDEASNQLTKVWTQIANRFKGYDKKLIFETLNEPRLVGSDEEWTGGTAEGRQCVNRLNKAAVDAIRATGGNNTERFVMVPTYAASCTQSAMDDFVIPNDDPNIIVSLHLYFPFDFCLGPLDSYGRSTWGSESDYTALTEAYENISKTFIDKGQAVVLGEWCTVLRENNMADRLRHADHYMKEATQRGICTILWDTDNGRGVFDRVNVNWRDTQVEFVDELFSVYEENKLETD